LSGLLPIAASRASSKHFGGGGIAGLGEFLAQPVEQEHAFVGGAHRIP
jgi:hypothetical protein